jgi:hypothetical protein
MISPSTTTEPRLAAEARPPSSGKVPVMSRPERKRSRNSLPLI